MWRLVYYFYIVPRARIGRLFGVNYVQPSRDASAASYWNQRPAEPASKQSYRSQG